MALVVPETRSSGSSPSGASASAASRPQRLREPVWRLLEPARPVAGTPGGSVSRRRGGLDADADRLRCHLDQNSDRDALLDLGRNPNAAGTTSRADAALTDGLLGYQLLAGLDYALTERQALVFKVRYADAFGAFENLDNPWQTLRGHESTVGPGAAPVRYGIDARNLGFWSVSAGFRVGF